MTTTNRNDDAAINPERLLARARAAGFGPGRTFAGPRTAAASRTVLLRLLGRMARDRLIVTEPDGTDHHFGPPHRADDPLGTIEATIEILDPRAWTAVVREGSIGLGRGFIEGWWRSDRPTDVVRVLIRNLHTVDEVRNRINRVTGRFGDTARRALPRTSPTRNREDIGTHYDLGNEFFRLFLDDSMTYSSAVFADAGSGGPSGTIRRDLLAGSLAKYDRLLSKLGVHADHQLLEIGTGWGGLAIRAAEGRGATVTTTTVSQQQYEEATARLTASPAGDKVRLLNRDWRELDGRFDRVVSIEMIEAVDWRDYDRFFGTIARCLAPDGMVGLQAICVPDGRYERVKNTEDFIRRFVFPGGFLPSLGAMARSIGRATRLQILDVEDFSAHYAETLRLWRTRFEERIDEVMALGLDDRFCRLWRFYLAYCEAGFLERHCTVNQIILVGPDWRPTGLDLRPV
ncbi:MAG: cyclopropane-fatty-acyl-phospholipid synthase family protein [Actinomycetota bacterium]